MNNSVTGTQGLNATVYLSICVMLALTWNKTALNGVHEINTKEEEVYKLWPGTRLTPTL